MEMEKDAGAVQHPLAAEWERGPVITVDRGRLQAPFHCPSRPTVPLAVATVLAASYSRILNTTQPRHDSAVLNAAARAVNLATPLPNQQTNAQARCDGRRRRRCEW